MPIHVYEGPDGEVRDVLLHGEPPDTITAGGKTFKRMPVVPVALVGVAKAPTMGQEILRGYRDEEIRRGSRFHSRLHHETVKRAWANDAPDE